MAADSAHALNAVCHAGSQTHSCTHARRQTFVHAQTQARTCVTHLHSHTHTQNLYMLNHANIRSHNCADTQTHVHTHTHTHTHTRNYTNTHVQTHSQALIISN